MVCLHTGSKLKNYAMAALRRKYATTPRKKPQLQAVSRPSPRLDSQQQMQACASSHSPSGPIFCEQLKGLLTRIPSRELRQPLVIQQQDEGGRVASGKFVCHKASSRRQIHGLHTGV